MNKDNDISNDDVSEYNNYNLNKCLEEYYDDENIVHNNILLNIYLNYNYYIHLHHH